ncbi:MAG: hypothetical protein LBQ20_09500 [Rhodanobacter sp.]|jgi:hypothetical protein|nr:hypothetical protein [Rhodanobacter sp.]
MKVSNGSTNPPSASGYRRGIESYLGVISLHAADDDLPLFLAHEVSGEVLWWGMQLTRHLDTNIPVYGLELVLIFPCAVKRRCLLAGVNPARQLSLQPVAIGATVEVTKLLKSSV